MSFYRSQKTSQLQKDHGLYSTLSGMSLQGLATGQILGYSTNPRTIQNMKKEMAKKHQEKTEKELQQALSSKCLMINFLYDYHNIHMKQVPTDLKRTMIAHMASSMVDIHPQIPAVQRTHVSPHREVFIIHQGQQRLCLGGADITAVNEIIMQGLSSMKNHFLDQLPPWIKQITPGNFHTIAQDFRVYSQPTGDDLETLQTCQLLDGYEHDLKSLNNYKESLDRVCLKYPAFEQYLQQNLLPFPADWPGWYYPKKLITNDNTGKYTSIIPEQGQFHVSLNAIEDTVLIFKHFFDELFSYVFGGILPNRPKPYQSSLCVTSALLGWLLVRDRIMRKFGLCKMHEFVSTFYLLEDVVPLVL